MDKGGVYEIDRRTKGQKMEMPLKWITFDMILGTGTQMCYCIFFILVAFPCFSTFVCLSIS